MKQQETALAQQELVDLASQTASAPEPEPTFATALEEGDIPPDDEGSELGLTLLERLDQRQNSVLRALDRLNADIERMVVDCQRERAMPLVAPVQMPGLTDGPQQSQSDEQGQGAAA